MQSFATQPPPSVEEFQKIFILKMDATFNPLSSSSTYSIEPNLNMATQPQGCTQWKAYPQCIELFVRLKESIMGLGLRNNHLSSLVEEEDGQWASEWNQSNWDLESVS